jgi:hypothetical protein
MRNQDPKYTALDRNNIFWYIMLVAILFLIACKKLEKIIKSAVTIDKGADSKQKEL